MKRYIARQPIFDRNLNVSAYELLYRDGDVGSAHILNGDQATRSVLSDAMMVFGLKKLTNSQMAYINFTEHLLMEDFVLLADPNCVTIEILETVRISDSLLARLEELRARGYHLALDDYTGDASFGPLLPLIDVLKVDFLETDITTQAQIAKRFRGKKKPVLLAEKVEDRETFQRAVQQGYRLFQGFFFEKPTPMVKEAPEINRASAVRLLRELEQPDIELSACAATIRADATLTYQLLRKVQTMRYYRGTSIQMIEQAVVFLGTDELRRWITLVLAREMNRTGTDESVRGAYVRGLFAESLVERSAYSSRKSDGFLLGMFSMMDRIMALPMSEVLCDIPLAEDVKAALLGTDENFFATVLTFLRAFEDCSAEELPALEVEASPQDIIHLYMQSIREADFAFSEK